MKLKIELFIVSIFFLICQVQAFDINDSKSFEKTISLNGNWNFKADYYNKGEHEGWYKNSFNVMGWNQMQVPGNWDLHNEFANYAGKGWYRIDFETPSNISGKIVRLNFESVGIDYKVWLNGLQIGNITGGYFPTDFNISDKLQKTGKNYLVVCADNSFKSGAYWSWGGIRRSVSLILNKPVFISSTKIIASPDFVNGTAAISAEIAISNVKSSRQNILLEYELHFKGQLIKKGVETIQLTGNRLQWGNIKISIAKELVKLWHFDFPNLYSLRIKLIKSNEPMHVIDERFGIRKTEIVNGQFLLNGEPIRAMGLNWVADDRLTGNTLPVDVYKRDIDNMKSLGSNLTRLSHLPLPKEVYDYLDEKGMLIIAEIPLWGTTALANPLNPISKTWMRQLVGNHFNHPSIIGWCVGNEIGDKTKNLQVMEYAQKAIQFVKDSLDNSRLVVLVSHTANYQKTDPSQFGDFVPYNTYGSWGFNVDKVHEYQPDKIVFVSEFGNNLIGEDLNSAIGNFPKMLQEFRGKKYVFGASLWTYNDYRSFHRSPNLTWDSKVSQNRDWGVVDGYGNKKRAYEIIRKEFAPLKSMFVSIENKTVKVSLLPRGILDLPAFNLRNYKLVYEVKYLDKQSFEKQELLLELIKPGDAEIHQSFAISGIPLIQKISILNPTGYQVMDTVIYGKAPEKPSIQKVFNTGDKIRVIFNHVDDAAEYKLLYGDQVLNQETGLTIDNFIEVQKLGDFFKKNGSIQIRLVAKNAFGQTSSDLHTEQASDFLVFPPVIKAVRTFQNGISIGYSSEKEDYLYKIQYATTANFSADTHVIQTTNKGACYIPNLKPGSTYYVRICAVQQYDLQSAWSDVKILKL
jgi:beta-galactosidase